MAMVRRSRKGHRGKDRPMFVLPVIPFPAINPILISIGPFAIRW